MGANKQPEQKQTGSKEKILRSARQGLIQAGGAVILGGLIGLIRSRGFLNGAIQFTYIWGICLAVFTLMSPLQGFKEFTEARSAEAFQEVKKKNQERASGRWVDYIRIAVVFLVAVMLENIKFYVL